MGDNVIVLNEEGQILSSQIPAFRVGNTVYDYIAARYHIQIQAVLANIKYVRRQPIVLDFEVLYQGVYYPRRARIYYSYGKGTLCFVGDIHTDSKIIRYSSLHTTSYNEFTVARNGLVMSCLYPEKTPTKDPVGLNVFDVLLPEYRDIVRATMKTVLRKRIELPIQYGYSLAGEVRHKTGTIKAHGGNAIFCVRRIAPPLK